MYQCTRRVAVLLGVSVLLASGGCGDTTGGVGNSVTGKVTLSGDPVEGQVDFVGADGKAWKSGLVDGIYRVQDVTLGEVTILITGTAPAPKDLVTPGGKTLPKLEMPGMPSNKSVPPPKKYSDPQQSGLKYTVKPGAQTHDITLTP